MTNDQEELTVEGPGGLKAAFKGSQTLQFLLAILVGLWMWYLMDKHEAKGAERAVNASRASAEVVAAIKEQTIAIKEQKETQKAMIYVLTLPEAERRRLNLVEPPQLRELRRYDR